MRDTWNSARFRAEINFFPVTRERSSCSNGDALNADKIEPLRHMMLGNAQLDGLANPRHQFVERLRLSMATRQSRHRGYEISFGILLDHNIELLTLHRTGAYAELWVE